MEDPSGSKLVIYTIIIRKLGDPIAYRLENLWWHVRGSGKKNLNGPTLTSIFEEISNVQLSVQLRGAHGEVCNQAIFIIVRALTRSQQPTPTGRKKAR